MLQASVEMIPSRKASAQNIVKSVGACPRERCCRGESGDISHLQQSEWIWKSLHRDSLSITTG